MNIQRARKAYLFIGLVCVALGAMCGCDAPWEDDDEDDCPYRDKTRGLDLQDAATAFRHV